MIIHIGIRPPLLGGGGGEVRGRGVNSLPPVLVPPFTQPADRKGGREGRGRITHNRPTE
jgi:hypothetical protein